MMTAAAGLLFYINWRMGRRHMYELAAKLPGEKGFPFIGNALKFALSPNRKQKINPKTKQSLSNMGLLYQR